ncbi:MAG: NADH dehydrogenase subunit 4 [Candidatus Thiodiazotropha sp. (ex. Lucinisca nassula)]|nr:NADH dehydrogenase subunit 4 [Candidatus Thiodiazotropha sp. (ex. Lucinisca nassula)]MBW9275003.1 NADH dehydrogenase subunit 4 [Candidatus Thiodiazotropha sp. (ex. Lucinisca nassula)]PUB84414.1 MAG: hypothetical protein DBP02_08965 [gamma proteobacterium symbiont of Ctena orbiculata]PUB90043.1 MAG: hypothetical protein DBP01_08795 [gamma proteobacterium symbiont of Ctena orbiculata]
MGLRYIFIALALWGVFLIGRHFWRQNQLKGNKSQQVKSVDSVQCAYCGLHLPKNEAVCSADVYYCSKAHQKAAEKQNS